MQSLALALLCAGALCAQGDGTAELSTAYAAPAQQDYDRAIASFRQGLQKQPQNAAGHKDLGYTLLKAGVTADARDEFAIVLQLDSHDDVAALEYAFLCYETGKPIEARRTFDRLRTHGLTATTRATAAEAFQNIDRPLAEESPAGSRLSRNHPIHSLPHSLARIGNWLNSQKSAMIFHWPRLNTRFAGR
jgi:Flp pilus assembly protein TadD